MNVGVSTGVRSKVTDAFPVVLAANAKSIFEHSEIWKIIALPIINHLEAERDESFAVKLYNPTGGTRIGKHPTTVATISNDDDSQPSSSRKFADQPLFSERIHIRGAEDGSADSRKHR